MNVKIRRLVSLSEKNGKWDLMKEPNMALREIRDIRPHLVLEGSFEPKTFWRQEREKS